MRITHILILSPVYYSDHRGCSNAQLAKEDRSMAELYQDKSIAEQNSLDLSWTLFMGPNYQQLRNAMFGKHSDLCRFRQLVVNVVLGKFLRTIAYGGKAHVLL